MSRRLKVPSGRRFGADDCAEAAFVGEQSAASLDVGLAAIARSGLPTLQGTWQGRLTHEDRSRLTGPLFPACYLRAGLRHLDNIRFGLVAKR